MTISIGYSETRTSAVAIDCEELRALLSVYGSQPTPYYSRRSESELRADLDGELASTTRSDIPSALESLARNAADISARRWAVTAQ